MKGVKHLNSKAYVFGSRTAIVTSANLTQAGLFRNAEFGVESWNSAFVREITDYFNGLWESAAPMLKSSMVVQWKTRIAEAVRQSGGVDSSARLGEHGPDLGLQESSEFASNPGQWPFPRRQCFVKFFGTGNDRAPRDMPVIAEIEGSGSHWALSYPRGRRPRQVKEGDLIFIARMVKDAPDISVHGRARGRKHVQGRDDASISDLRRRAWKTDWPHYIRAHEL